MAGIVEIMKLAMNRLSFQDYWKFPLRVARKLINLVGYELVQRKFLDAPPTDPDPDFIKLIEDVRPFSMATKHRLAAMADAVQYVVRANIPGSIVECGVWRGANMMLAAKTLLAMNVTDRDLYLYDTFEGMSPPTMADKDYFGVSASKHLAEQEKGTGVWCEASIQDVRANMESTGYPMERIHLVKGMIENTIPATVPGSIALLRLDTDWYESTKHEMEYLYPILQFGGTLLIDDYGHWQGSRKAVDEYFEKLQVYPMLHRIDFSCRSMVKPN